MLAARRLWAWQVDLARLRRCTTAGAFLTAALVATSACQKTEADSAVGAGTGGVISITDGSGGAAPDGSGGTTPDGTGGATPDGTGGNVTPGTGGAEMDAPVEAASGSGGAAPDTDGGAIDDVPAPSPDVAIDSGPPPTECNTPSIDRFQQWQVASEVTAMTQPAKGNILVKEDDHYVGKVNFVTGKWHIVAVWLGNLFDAQVDLSASTGFTLTYSATATFYVQLRTNTNYTTGDHYLVQLGSTGGQMQTVFVPLTPQKWTTLPRLGTPKISFADALKQVRALFFIGDVVVNTVTFRELLIDGYTPPCH